MEVMPKTTGEWLWWAFSVLLISFFVNLASSYAKPVFDNLGARYSERRRKRLEEKAKEWDRTVISYSNQEGLVSLKLELLLTYVKLAFTAMLTIFLVNLAGYTLFLGTDYLSNFIPVRYRLYAGYIQILVRSAVYIVTLIPLLFYFGRVRYIRLTMRTVYAQNPTLAKPLDTK